MGNDTFRKIKNIDLFKCNVHETVIDAMKSIEANSCGTLYVIEDDGDLAGCVTDGNIRRYILRGGDLNSSVSAAMNPSPVSVHVDAINDALRIMDDMHITSIAVVDDDYRLVDVIFADPHIVVKKDTLKGVPVVIMAGGKGTRLYPYTKILPKPLIPIGDTPIIERILNKFMDYGADRFYLTVNYRREMIKAYLSETNAYNIKYVEEDEPLGTAGSISLIEDKFDGPIIISNCDILIEADYGNVLRYHRENGNDLTIVSSLKNTVIPYGVLHTDDSGMVMSMEEKPSLSSFVNTGMYIVNPEYIEWIPKGRVFHMTELAELMIREHRRVGMYPISENSFLDMGEFAELNRMENMIGLS